jgi:hypothetical protein
MSTHLNLLRTLLLVSAALVVAGCGGGTLALTGPTVADPAIATSPSPLTSGGGTATVRVHITGSSILNTSTNPPRADVRDVTGVSLLGGPQPLVNDANDSTAWSIQFDVPANATASPKVYQVTITAQSISGATGNTPFFAGAITVPGR